MLTEKLFAAKGMSINYVEGPPNGRPIVLLHGITNRWQTWSPVLPLLGWQYHCYALDQRGHGRSGHATDGYQSERFAQDVIQFLQEVVKKPVVLIGHSLGAMITLKVAAQAPNLIQAIVLGDPPLSAAADRNGEIPPWFKQYYDLMKAPNTREEKLERLTEITEEGDRALIFAHLKSLEMLDPEVLVTGETDRLFEDFALADLLPKITCPSLLIQGNPALGGVMEKQDAEHALSLMKNVIRIYVDDMGHNLHVPQPNRFVTMVNHFIDGLGS